MLGIAISKLGGKILHTLKNIFTHILLYFAFLFFIFYILQYRRVSSLSRFTQTRSTPGHGPGAWGSRRPAETTLPPSYRLLRLRRSMAARRRDKKKNANRDRKDRKEETKKKRYFCRRQQKRRKVTYCSPWKKRFVKLHGCAQAKEKHHSEKNEKRKTWKNNKRWKCSVRKKTSVIL